MACKGRLTKQGGVRKNWLTRWFVLDLVQRTLCYYGDESEASLKGTIALGDISCAVHPYSNSDKGHRQFDIVTAARTYHIQAADAKTMQAWLDLINLVCAGSSAADSSD